MRGFSYWADAPARHAHGQRADADRGDGRQRLRRRPTSPRSSRATARSASPAASRARSSPRRPLATTGDLVDAIKAASPPPPGAAVVTRRAAPSRPSAWRSTASCRTSRTGSTTRCTCSTPEGRIARARVPLARGPHGEGALRRLVAHRGAGLRADAACPRAPSAARWPGCSPGAPLRPTDAEVEANPRARQRPPARGRAARAMTTVAAPTRRTPPARTSRAHDAAPARARAPRAYDDRASPPRTRHVGRVRRPRSRVVTVVALVIAVVFHVVLARGPAPARPAQRRRSPRSSAPTSSAGSPRRLLASPQRIIEEAERLGLVVPPDPPQYLNVDGAPLPGDRRRARPPTPSRLGR